MKCSPEPYSDVNGDGRPDIIVGAPSHCCDNQLKTGKAYVVFGKADTATVELANLGAGGFRIEGANIEDFFGISVSGAGDVNGDGLEDIVIGAEHASPNGNLSAGGAYVVFGKATTETVSATDLGNDGFRIDGIDVDDGFGRSVSGAGDINQDGLDDVIIGSFFGGAAVVVFGKADGDSVDLGSVGDGGITLLGRNINSVSDGGM